MSEQRSYHFKPNTNLPTHYTLALRNHETFHMVEEHSKAPDLDKITIKLMLNPGSKNSNSRGTID